MLTELEIEELEEYLADASLVFRQRVIAAVTHSRPAEDERVKEIRGRLDRLQLTQDSFRQTVAEANDVERAFETTINDLIKDARYLLGLLPVQLAQNEIMEALMGMVAAFDTYYPDESVARVTRESAMNEAKRVLGWDKTIRVVQPAASTPTEEPRCEHGVLQSMECLNCTEEYVAASTEAQNE